ncbi:MAG TPA: glycosyltransferase family 4 protein [Vicinamibacterales bacterium]|jgi:glycosyltransferase involved in cell wall biosynthesis
MRVDGSLTAATVPDAGGIEHAMRLAAGRENELPAPPPWFDSPFGVLGITADGVCGLLTDLEDALGVRVENGELRPDTLQSPRTLSAMVRSKVLVARRPKKRIVHVTSDYLPHLSGTQRQIADICAHLSEPLEHLVFTYDRRPDLPAHAVIDGVPVARFTVPRWTDVCRLRRRVATFGAAGAGDAEALCNYTVGSSDLFGALQQSNADAIVTYFYPQVLAQDVVEFFPSRQWLLVPSFFQPPGLRGGDRCWYDAERIGKLLVLQEPDYRHALAWGIPRQKLVQLPYPVDTDRFRPLPVERDKETLLFVGRLTANKGVRAFLETFRGMVDHRPALRLRLVGDIESSAPVERQEIGCLRAAIERLGLTNHVEFAGRREGDDVVAEYSRCRIHVLPSIADFYSYVTAEALACGMTCVNLDLPSYHWQRSRVDGAPLVHLCQDLPEMGRKILGLLDSDEFVDHRDYMVAHFSWKVLHDGYRDFFCS